MITANRIIRPQPTPDGWYPTFSLDGRFLAWGGGTGGGVYVHDTQTGTSVRVTGTGILHAVPMGWLDNRFLGILDNGSQGDKDFWLHDVQTGETKKRPDLADPHVLYQVTHFEMRDGHWGTSRAAPPFELMYDNKRVNDNTGQPAMGHGVSVRGPWMVTGNARDGRYNLHRYYCGVFHSEINAASPFFTINERGDVFYGYGSYRVNRVDGRDEDATTTPWRTESVPVSIYADDELWLFQAIENAGRTWTIARRISDDHDDGVVLIECAAAVAFSHAPNLTVAYNNGEFRVAMCDAKGALGYTSFRKDEPRDVLTLTIPRTSKNLTVVSFHQFTERYGDAPDYPAHMTVIDQEGNAAARAAQRMPIILTATSLRSALSVKNRVAGLYIGDTGGWKNAEALAKER